MKRFINKATQLALVCAVLCMLGGLLPLNVLAADLSVAGGNRYGDYLTITAVNDSDTSYGSCSLSSDTISIVAKGYTDGFLWFTTNYDSTTTVTVTSSYPGTMTISYATGGTAPTVSVASGDGSVNTGMHVITLNANKSFTVSVTSPSGSGSNTGSFTFGEIELGELRPNVTFLHPSNGSYTVSYDGLQEVEPYGTFGYSNRKPYDLYATPAAGYEFFAWVDDQNKIMSFDPVFSYRGTANRTIRALFFHEGNAVFYIKGAPGTYYDYFDQAQSAAGTNGVIIAAKSGELLSSTGATSLSLSAGKTLLVPHGSDVTSINGSSDKHPYACESLVDTTTSSNTMAKPETNAYITLTLPAGHTLTVNGTLAVGGTLNGIGWIVSDWTSNNITTQVYHANLYLDGGASLNVASGGVLSSCGFIYGSGTVEAQSGAKVYVPYSVMDFRGGGYVVGAAGQVATLSGSYASFLGNSAGIADNPSTEKGIAPFLRYTVNAIQSTQTVRYGATVYGYVDLYAGGDHNRDCAALIGVSSDNPLLVLGADSSAATLSYDGSVCTSSYPAVGKTRLVVNGAAEFGGLVMNVSMSNGNVNAAIDTRKINFPLPYNYEVEIAGGTFTVPSDLLILPGAKVTVDAGATLNVNASLSVYDGLHDYTTSGTDKSTKVYLTGFPPADPSDWTSISPKSDYPGTTELQQSSFGGSGAADLVVNGTLNLKSGAKFGGIIQTSGDSAQISVDSNATLSTTTQVGLVGNWGVSLAGYNFTFAGATVRTLYGQILDAGTGRRTNLETDKTYYPSVGFDSVNSYTYNLYYATDGTDYRSYVSRNVTEPVSMVLRGSWYNYTVTVHVVGGDGTSYGDYTMYFAHGADVTGLGYYSDSGLTTSVTSVTSAADLYYRGEPEAKVVWADGSGETSYLTLRLAGRDAVHEGDRIVLLRDLEDLPAGISVGAGQSISFDMDGHTISSDATIFSVAAGGTLALDLNGGAITGGANSIVTNNGTMTVDLNSGTITGGAGGAFTNNGTMSVDVNGGTIAAGTDSVVTNNGTMTVDLNSGTITGGADTGSVVTNNGTMTVDVNGGTLRHQTGGSVSTVGATVVDNYGALTVQDSAPEKGGLITTDACSNSYGNSYADLVSAICNRSGATLTVTGGTFEATETTNVNLAVINNLRGGTVAEISGGAFHSAKGYLLFSQGTVTEISGGAFRAEGVGAIYPISGTFGTVSGGSFWGAGENTFCLYNYISGDSVTITGGYFKATKTDRRIVSISNSDKYEFAGNKNLSTVTCTSPDFNESGFYQVVDFWTVTFDDGGYMATAPATASVEDGLTAARPDSTPESAETDFLNGWVYEWQLNGEAYDFASPVTEDLTLTLVHHQIDMARVIWADGSAPTSYRNVQAALDAATHAGDRIVLLADQRNCNFTVTGLSGGRIFDLNGKTVTSENTIVSVGAGTGLTLELNGGTLDRQTGATASADSFQSAAAVDNEGTLTVTGPGTVRMDGLSNSTRAAAMSAAIRNGGTLTLEGGVTVRGVPRPDASTSKAYLVGVANHDQGEIQTVSDGKYEGLIAGIFNSAKVDGIQGGTFIAQSGVGAGYYSSSYNYSTHITGGLFYCGSNNIRDKAIYNWSVTSIITYDNGFTLSKSPNSDGYYYITAYYDVSFQDRGSTIGTETDVELGSRLAEPEVSAEGWTLEGWYRDSEFAENGKWSFSTDTVTADTVLYAKWTCAVSFDMQGHGTDAQPETQTVLYGACAGQPAAPAAGDTVTENGETYRFDGWYQDQSCTEAFDFAAAVPGNAAVWAKWTRVYSVTFLDENGDTLQSGWAASGETPAYTGATPEKAATAQYSYTFSGWSPEISAVSGDATYTAVYSSTVREYTITFANEDGTELQSGPTAYGAMPAYTGATPEKAATAQYSYTFDHWDPAITSVMGDATYTAVYSSTVNEYTITFVNADGTELQSGLTAYGEMPAYTGATPTRAADEQYTYTFSGWNDGTTAYAADELPAATGDATYTAQFTATANEAKIGTAYYTTLTDAIDAARNDDTILLLADVTGQYTIPSDKSLTLDLNGKTVANDQQVIEHGVITNNGTLTLNLNDGVVKYQTGATAANDAYKGKAAVDNYGSLTVNGPGTVMADPLESSSKAADLCAAIRNCGALTMQNGVTVWAVPSSAATGYLIGVVNYSSGTIAQIEDGEYDGYIAGVFNNATIQKITGGTFIAHSSSGWAYFTNQETTLTGGYYKNIVNANPEKAVYRSNIRYETANHTLSKSPNAEGYYYITAYYDVSFDLRGHGQPIDPVTEVETGSKLTAPTAPTAEGYTFGGWYKESSCDTPWNFATDTVTADTTLYAKWTLNTYTITWSIDGTETTETLAYGATPAHADPTKAADEQYTYTFSGWEPAIASVTGDATYTAQFTGTANVAKIGSAYYTTLSDAITAANSMDTVTLLADVTGNYTIPSGKRMTLDLAGHSITSDVGNVLTNNGVLVLELNGGKVDFHTGASVGSEAYQGMAAIVNSGTMTVQDTAGGGKVTTDAAVSNVSKDYLNKYISALLNTGGTLTVSGGKFVATETVNDRSQGVFIKGGQVDLISGGEFEGRDYGLIANAYGQIVAITGGTFTGAGEAGCGLYNYSFGTSSKGAAQVSGGYFKGSSRENAIKDLTNTYSYVFPSGCVLSDTTTTAPNGQSGYYYVYKTVTVTYQQRVNGELVTVAEDTIPAGELRELKTLAELGLTAPEGFVFQQWNGSNDRAYADGEAARFYESVTLTAQWAPVEGNGEETPVTVNWYDGMTGALLRTDYLESLEDLSQPTVRTHEGYAFTGWRVELNNETLTTVSPSPITRDVLVSTISIAVKTLSDSETFDIYAEYSDKADIQVTIQYQLGDAAACAITAADAFIQGVPESVTDGVLTVKAGKLVHLIAATEFQAGDVSYVFDHWTYGEQSIQNRDILVRPPEALTLTAVYVEGSGEPVEPEIICYISDLFSELVNGKTKIGATMSFSVPDDGNYTVLMAGLFYSRNQEDFANGTATYKGFVPDQNAGDYTHRLSSKSNTYNFYFQGYIKYTLEGEEIEVFSEIVGPYDWIDPTQPGEDGNRATEPEALEQTQAAQGQEESEQIPAEIEQSVTENQAETAASIPEAQKSTEPKDEALSESTETLSPRTSGSDAGSK